MLQSSPLEIKEADGVKSTVLVKSSAKAWTQDPDGLMLNPLVLTPPEDSKALSTRNLMVLLEGEFNSAFDEAPVSAEKKEEGQGDYAISTHLSKSKQAGKIIVAGTSMITTPQVFPDDASQGIALLLVNAIDYLNGNEELCRMRTKGVTINVLDTQSKAKVTFFQLLNEYGLAIFVVIAGLIVWRLRIKRKARINRTYNPDDDRFAENDKKSEADK
jgi:hypothetical protein